MKGFFKRYLYAKYQNPIPYGSQDKAQVKVFSLRYDTDADADTGVMTLALQTVVAASLKYFPI
jgi:hypothetical protein